MGFAKYSSIKIFSLSIVLILSIMLCPFLNITNVARAETFSSNTLVNDVWTNNSTQLSPSIVIDSNDIIYVIWEDWRNDADGYYQWSPLGGIDGVFDGDIYICSSTDGGLSFGPDYRVNDDSGKAHQRLDWSYRSIAVDENGTLHAVWTDFRNDADGFDHPDFGIDGVNNSDIFYANSADGGISWSKNIKINDDVGGERQQSATIAVDSKNNIHVVWEDERNGIWDIYYTNSSNGGATFSSNVKVNDVSTASRQPTIDVDNLTDNIYVVWRDWRDPVTDPDIYFARSIDGGLTFENNKKVNSLDTIYDEHSFITVRDGLIGVVWVNYIGGEFGIYFAASTDEGETFSDSVKVNDNPGAWDWPHISIDSTKKISVVWEDRRNGNTDIYYANSTDGGLAFGVNQIVNDDTVSASQRMPAIDVDSNDFLHIVWADWRREDHPNRDIYYARTLPTLLAPNYIPWDSQPESPTKISVGNSVEILTRIKNIGWQNATSSSLVAFYNQSASVPFKTYIVPPLSSGKISDIYPATWIAPAIPGIYNITIKVDWDATEPGGVINESDEDNNIYTIEFEVVAVPNTTIHLGMPQYNATSNLFVNSSTQFTFTVEDYSNTGHNTFYYIDNPPWNLYNGAFTVLTEGLHTIYYNTTDNLGGIENTKTFEMIVDNTPPMTNTDVGDPKYISSDTWVTSNTGFILNMADCGLVPVGVNYTEYRIWNGTWSTWNVYQSEFTLDPGDGMRYLEFRSMDLLGNAETVNNDTYIVDNTPPTTNIKVGDPKHENGDTWMTSNTEITLSATDSGLIPVGLDYIEYRIWNNSSWTTWVEYSNAFTLDVDDGLTYLEFYSIDYLGNNENIHNETYFMDNTPPVTTHILQLESDNTEARIILIASDVGSGVNYTKYRVDSGDWATYSGTFIISESGQHTIYFWSIDRLGNVEIEKNFSVFIEEPGIVVPPGDGEEEVNWKPLIALIFTIILLLVGTYVSHKRPLKFIKNPKRKQVNTWLSAVLPFAVAEIATGVISGLTGLLAVPPLLGPGMAVDLAILILGLFIYILIYKKLGEK